MAFSPVAESDYSGRRPVRERTRCSRTNGRGLIVVSYLGSRVPQRFVRLTAFLPSLRPRDDEDAVRIAFIVSVRGTASRRSGHVLGDIFVLRPIAKFTFSYNTRITQ